MDAPPIRYARTDAGERIAYWTAGSGTVLLHLDPPGQEIGTDWERADFPVWCAALASRFKLIRAQLPGRSIGSTAPEERERTVALLDAVLEAERAPVCAVFGVAHSTPPALLYAAARPAVVSHLALWNPYANGATYAATSIRYLLEGIEAIDVKIWSRLVAVAGGASSWDELERMAEESLAAKRSRGNVDSALKVAAMTDVLDVLPAIAASVLAFHSKEAHFVGLAATQEVAELLPDCQFLMVDDAGHQPWARRPEEFADRISAFVGGSAAALRGTSRGFQTILFTDLESSTALTSRVGDEAAQEVLRGHNVAVRNALDAHGGLEVKHTGDGIMASFPSAVSAVEAALAVQRDLAGGDVRVRIGINAGEPIAEDDDFFGTVVQLAARITDRAEPAQVLVSNVVRELCAGKSFEFTPIGEATLKGFSEPVALFEVNAPR